ncbi:hypothetical protein FQR65_LT10158 [Abscondita terminalis]|nr:hypothetical protein FQR65_LT10158 [Abscondita terminalis]
METVSLKPILKKHHDWLKTPITTNDLDSPSTSNTQNIKKAERLKKKCLPVELSPKQENELTHATTVKFRQSGKSNVDCVLIMAPNQPVPEEALGLITVTKLSHRNNQIIRKFRLNLYPSHEKIKLAQQMPYPPDEDCTISKSIGKIQL